MSTKAPASSSAKGDDRNGPAVRSKPAPAARLAPGLYLVATPIGNLRDITVRAIDVLNAADQILCEDTRITGRLLAAHGIATPMATYHEHNAARARPRVLAKLSQGAAIALVSDAGTPLVSDPGYKLVRGAIEADVAVTAIPGASAALAALQVSGLPSDRFLFAGFLPPKEAARRRALAELAATPATLVFFESARRLAATLHDMAETLGDREAAVARELTKLHEEIRRDTLSALAVHYAEAGPPRGEVVLVVAPPREDGEAPSAEALDRRLEVALADASLRDAVAAVSAETGVARQKVYARALALKRAAEREG